MPAVVSGAAVAAVAAAGAAGATATAPPAPAAGPAAAAALPAAAVAAAALPPPLRWTRATSRLWRKAAANAMREARRRSYDSRGATTALLNPQRVTPCA